VLSATTTSPLVCFVQLFYPVCGCMLSMCVCVPDVLVCGMSGCDSMKVMILISTNVAEVSF
jgi:hypothetical protein